MSSIDHKEMCKILEIPEEQNTDHKYLSSWTVRKTKIKIFVEEELKLVMGGAIVCGYCGYGVSGMTYDTDECPNPECGCTQATVLKDGKKCCVLNKSYSNKKL